MFAKSWKRIDARIDARLQARGRCALDIFDAPDPPAPDPNIGQAAAANAEVGREALGLAREQWAWNKEQAERLLPKAERVVDQQISIADQNAQRSQAEWDAYQSLYRPAEEQYVRRTLEWDSPGRRTEREQMAVADVNRGYDMARGTMERGLARAGVRPGGSGYAQAQGDLARAQAGDTAGAINNARRQVEAEGMAGLERLTNVGRGRPSTSFAADQLALSAGNSATANQNQTVAAQNAGMGAAQGWYNTSLAGFRGQGDILNNQYGNELRGWQAGQEAASSNARGLGQLVGTALPFFFNRGGMVKSDQLYANGGLVRRAQKKLMKYANGGMVGPKFNMTFGLARGGMIEGPGTETSDSVPAMIDGEQPAQLSTGEAVLNAEAVKLVGEQFIENVNAAGLERRGQMPERMPQTDDGLSRRVG